MILDEQIKIKPKKTNTTKMMDSSSVKIPSVIPIASGTATAMLYTFDFNRAIDTIIYTIIGAITSVLVTYAVKKVMKIK